MRLIDADEFIREMNDLYSRAEWDKRDIHFSLRDVEMNIYMQPTIDAEPVKHGKWDDTRVAFYRKCSECGATVKNNLPDVFLDCDIRDLHYCPNCGAKMDEVNE